MSVSDLISKRFGVANPSSVTKDVTESLNAALNEIIQARKLKEVTDAVKVLASEPAPQPSLFAGLKDLGIDVKSMIEVSQKAVESAHKQLEEERSKRIENEKLLLEKAKEDKAQELSLAEKLVTLVTTLQNKTTEQQIKFLEDRIRQAEESNKPKNDPVLEFMKDTLMDLLKEKLASKQVEVDPVDQLSRSISMVEKIKSLFPSNSKESDELRELQYKLEMRKLELEDEWRRQEQREKMELEKRKLDNWSNIFNQFTRLIPGIVAVISGKAPANIESTYGQEINVCPKCGENLVNGVCPNCSSQGNNVNYGYQAPPGGGIVEV